MKDGTYQDSQKSLPTSVSGGCVGEEKIKDKSHVSSLQVKQPVITSTHLAHTGMKPFNQGQIATCRTRTDKRVIRR